MLANHDCKSERRIAGTLNFGDKKMALLISIFLDKSAGFLLTFLLTKEENVVISVFLLSEILIHLQLLKEALHIPVKFSCDRKKCC